MVRYSKSLEKRIKELEATVKQQDSHRMELEFALEEKEKEISHLNECSPIAIIGKVHSIKKRGAL